MLKSSPTACAAAVALLLVCSPGRAQYLPASADQSPDQKADQPPPVVEKVRRYVEDNPIVQKLSGDGVYPRIGGLSPGSGLAGGVGYRRHLRWVYLDVSGLASTKAYRGIDAEARWVDTSRVRVSNILTFRNNTQDDFYGLGIDTTDATRVDYGIRTTDLAARASARVIRGLRLGAAIGYLMPAVRHGRDDNLRSIAEVFTDATAPGLARQPDFEHHGVFAEMDSRDAAGFPRRGGFYRAAYALWNDRTFGEYGFRRTDLVGSQFVSLSPKSVVALRLDLTYANNAPGDRVPFYMLPYVGGGDTVRAFREFRFRDENAGLFNVELRRKIHPMAHLAAFVDLGKVAHDWQDINPAHVKRAYGFGVRAGSDERLYLRFDVAYGGDGTRVFLKFAPAF